MTLYEFLSLDELEKANAVWEGQFITYREEEEFTIMLYRIGDFYCEVFYQRSENAIIKLRPFKTKKFLEPYFNIHLN